MLSISELVFSVILVGLVMIGKSPLHRLFSKKIFTQLAIKEIDVEIPKNVICRVFVDGIFFIDHIFKIFIEFL